MPRSSGLPEIDPEWTPRQREVLDLLVRGRTNGEIAQELGIGLEGAKFHVSEILSKLQVDSREDAAEYWRQRNGLRRRFRIAGSIGLGSAGRLAAGGAAVLAVVAAGVVLVMILAAGEEEPREGAPDPSLAPTHTITNTPVQATAPVSTPGVTLPPFTPVVAVEQVSAAHRDVITGGWGLVFGNPATGGAEVWLLPDGTSPSGVSPQGQYFVYGKDLFDAFSGARSPLDLQGDVLKSTFAPDDSAVVVMTSSGAALYRNDGSLLLRSPAMPSPQFYEAMWSPDSRAVALTRRDASGTRVDLVLDGRLEPAPGSLGMTDWASTGLRLAITEENPAIYDLASGKRTPLRQAGTYPSWAPGDEYLAIDIARLGAPGLGVLDTATGEEVMRVYNSAACMDIYWYAGPALQGTEAGAIHVPTGDAILYSDPPPAPFPRIEFGIGLSSELAWVNSAGHTYATVGISTTWAYSVTSLRRDVPEWPPVIHLGLGGKGLCLGHEAPPVVAKPPFSPDQVPTPTASPTPK